MDDCMDSRRCAPVMEGGCQPSMNANYQPSGSGGNNNSSSRLARTEEAVESSSVGGVCGQGTGKSPQCSEAPTHKKSQSSAKLVAAEPSQAENLQRPYQFSVEGPWTALQGFSGDLNSSMLDCTRAGANSDTGLDLSLPEEDAIPSGHLQPTTNSSANLGMRGHLVSSPDSLAGRVPIQGSSKGEFIPVTCEFFPSNVGGNVTENEGTQITLSGLPTLGNRQARASASAIYSGERLGMNERRRVNDGGRSRTYGSCFMEGSRFQDLGRNSDGRRVEHASVRMTSDSFYMEQQLLRTAEPELFGSNSNHTGGMDVCLSEASGNQELFNTGGAYSSEGYGNSADQTYLKHSISGSLGNATSSVFGNMRDSSRGSACKRKSCTPVVAGSLACGSSSLRDGFQDSNGGRTVGCNGMSRCTIGISGCTSASDVVASTSSSAAAASGQSSELSIVAGGGLEEPITRRATSLREALELMPETRRGSCLGKSVVTSSSAGTNSQRNIRGGGVGMALVEAGTAQHSHTSSAQTVYRSLPAMQDDHCGSQRATLSESLVDANEESSHSSLLVPDETPTESSTLCHNVSPSRLTCRSGNASSPQHRDNSVGLCSLGEQVSCRYKGSSTHSFASSLSSASQLGAAVGTDSGLHNQAINLNNLESMSLDAMVLAKSVPPTIQATSTRVSSPSPSRPPHPSRGRVQGNTVQALLTNPSMSGPAPSCLSASPPVSARGGTHLPRLVVEGLAEILFALECVERDDDLTYEQLLMLEATLLFEGMGLHDHHRDLRLDVDNMSYEELLALEDRIGNVSTGLTAEAVADKLKRSYYSSLDMVVAQFSQEYDIKCSICQEEYEDGDELGKVGCGHSYHVLCVQQWLVQKNQCPICKAPAFA